MIGRLIVAATRLVVGGQGIWVGTRRATSSASISPITAAISTPCSCGRRCRRMLRRRVRPVAATDYWGKGTLQRHIALGVLNAVLIDRQTRSSNPLEPLERALAVGRQPDHLPRRHARDRRASRRLQARPASSRQGISGGGTGAGLSRQSAPRPAQGQPAARAAELRRPFRLHRSDWSREKPSRSSSSAPAMPWWRSHERPADRADALPDRRGGRAAAGRIAGRLDPVAPRGQRRRPRNGPQPQRADQGVVGDGGGVRGRLHRSARR